MRSHDLFIKLTIRRLKRKQKQHLTARKNAGISNNGLNSTDRPPKPIGYSKRKYGLRGSPRRLPMRLMRPSDRTKLRKGCALGLQDLLTITLYRVTRKTNTDENGRLRDDECD